MIFISEETAYIGGGGEIASADADEMNQLIAEEGIVAEDGMFSDDETGSIEICLEMETSWSALMQDMACLEHKAIVNENTDILSEGVMKDFWAKIVAMFKKAWAYVADNFRKVWDFITRRFQNAEKWWKANSKDISVASTKYKTFPKLEKGTPLSANDLSLAGAVMSSKTKEEVEGAMVKKKDLLKTMLGGDRTDVTVSKAAIGSFLGNANTNMASLKAVNNSQAVIYKNGIMRAQAAGKAESDGVKSAELKKEIEATKAKARAFGEIFSITVKASNVLVSDAFGAAKQMLRESGKSAPAAAPEKK